MAKANKWKLVSIFSIVLMVIGGLSLVYFLGFKPAEQTQVGELGKLVEQSLDCPDTLSTAGSITVKNEEDSVTDDTYDNVGYLYKVIDGNEEYDSSITDTTAGSATLDCGTTYRLRLVRQNANEGDNSKITSLVTPKDGSAQIIDNGQAVEFKPDGRSYSLKVMAERHGVLEFKAYDNVQSAYMCDSDASCTAWEADGTTFESTTNATAMAITATDELNIKLYFRATQANTSFDDFGYIILFEQGASALTTWEVPSFILNGVPLEKSTLVGDEAVQFTAYEYAYRLSDVDNAGAYRDVVDTQQVLEVVDKPKAAQNPSADLEIDFAAIGGFLSVDGATVKYAAAQDDSSATVVFTVQDVTIDIS